jgi:hypothetical protein
MAKYTWTEGPKPAVSADVFGEIVEELAAGAAPGSVQPELIVEKARPRSSPIHLAFDWRDKEAAHLYRIEQARHLVRRLQIVRVEVRHNPTISSRAFYSVRTPDDRQGYVPRSRVLSDRDLRGQVIARAKRELESFLKKYASVLTLSRALPHLNDAIDAMRDEIDQLEIDATRRRDPPKPGGKDERVAAE